MAFFNKRKTKNDDKKEDVYQIFESFAQKQSEENKKKSQGNFENYKFNDNDFETNLNESNPYMVSSVNQRTQEIPGLSNPSLKGQFAQNDLLVGTSIIIGKRSNQQDALATSNPNISGSFNERWLGVLCDGMGGMNGGEKASSLSVRFTIESFKQINLQKDIDIPNFYKNLISKIDFEVSSLEDEKGNYLGAGTTFISVIIDNGNLYWASVGDSHIYIIRGNQIEMVVREHNYLMNLLEMAESGEITYEEAYSDKSKDALTSYIGMGGVTLMDVISTPVKLCPGDIIMLCSDGLYRTVTDQEILQIVLNNKENMKQAAQSLTQFAIMKNNPYQDNTSVILACYK